MPAPGRCSARRWLQPDSPSPSHRPSQVKPLEQGQPRQASARVTGACWVKGRGPAHAESLLQQVWEGPKVCICNHFSGDGDTPKPGATLRTTDLDGAGQLHELESRQLYKMTVGPVCFLFAFLTKMVWLLRSSSHL